MRIRIKEKYTVRFRMVILALAVALCVPLAGCGGAAYDEMAETMSEDAGFQTGSEAAAVDDAVEEDGMVDTEDVAEQEGAEAEQDAGAGNGQDETKDNQDKILVYEGSVAIEAIEYEETVRAFKAAVEEFGGFLEDEQNFGAGSGDYLEDSYSVRDVRDFMATARIPSEKYQEFMAKTEGLGKVTGSNSKVTNMTRQYGTLKAELEIYETEYERYLKMFDEVSDDNAMLAIQEKLTELSLNIARTKSEMEVIDTDATFSTVQVRISEVQAYKEQHAGFLARLCDVLAKSWSGMLGFFEGILFFFILHWYKLLLFALIIVLIIKIVQRQQAKAEVRRQKAMQEYQQRRSEQQEKREQQEKQEQEEKQGQQEKREQEEKQEQKESFEHE